MKLGLLHGKVIVTIIGNLYGIILRFDVVTELCSLDGCVNGVNYIYIEGLLLWYSLGYTHGKVLSYDDVIKIGLSGGKWLELYLEM